MKGVQADAATPAVWAEALANGARCIEQHGGCRVGDRSMVDALTPAATAASRTAGVQRRSVINPPRAVHHRSDCLRETSAEPPPDKLFIV